MDFVDRAMEGVQPCEAIIHAAAAMSHDLYDPALSVTNCLGTQQLLKLAAQWGSRQVIYLSGVPVIGRPRYHPIDEDHPAQPLTAYHASKLFGEHLMAIAEPSIGKTVTLRLTSPAGSGTPTTRILAAFVRRAMAGQPIKLLGRGTRRQNYVDVRDVAFAVEASLLTGVSGLYNIAATASISNLDLARACVEECSSSSAIEFDERPDPEEGITWEVTIAKAQRDFGYSPQFTVRDSIRALRDEYSDSK
jgi:UDP-glucose 4-epimerase